jgi:hypothetical protein
MEVISELQNIDLTSWIIVGFMIMTIIVTFYEVICKVCAIFNKPIGAMKQRKADHALLVETVQDLKQLHEKHEEDTKQSIKHDKIIKEELSTLTNTVNSIATNLEDMERKNNETKVKELKDTLINYYNKYRVVGEWSNLEKEAFWELFEDYESRGGNGFIHSIVEPVMRELKVVD